MCIMVSLSESQIYYFCKAMTVMMIILQDTGDLSKSKNDITIYIISWNQFML